MKVLIASHFASRHSMMWGLVIISHWHMRMWMQCKNPLVRIFTMVLQLGHSVATIRQVWWVTKGCIYQNTIFQSSCHTLFFKATRWGHKWPHSWWWLTSIDYHVHYILVDDVVQQINLYRPHMIPSSTSRPVNKTGNCWGYTSNLVYLRPCIQPIMSYPNIIMTAWYNLVPEAVHVCSMTSFMVQSS